MSEHQFCHVLTKLLPLSFVHMTSIFINLLDFEEISLEKSAQVPDQVKKDKMHYIEWADSGNLIVGISETNGDIPFTPASVALAGSSKLHWPSSRYSS